MKKIAQILFGIVALLAFVAATPPIRYSIYTTGTVAQVDAHVSSVSTNLAMNGVSSFNTRVGAVALLSNDVVTALGYAPGTGSGSGQTNWPYTAITNAPWGLKTNAVQYIDDLSEWVVRITTGDPVLSVNVNTLIYDGSGGFQGVGTDLTLLNASNLGSGTVPLERLSGITSNELDAGTWLLATNTSSISGITSNQFEAATWLLATNTTPGWRLTEPGYVGGSNTFEPVYAKTQGTNIYIVGVSNSAADGLYAWLSETTVGTVTTTVWSNAGVGTVTKTYDDNTLAEIYTFHNLSAQTNFYAMIDDGPDFGAVAAGLSGGLIGSAVWNWTTNYTFGGWGVNGQTPTDGAVLAFGDGLDYTTNGSIWTIFSTNIPAPSLGTTNPPAADKVLTLDSNTNLYWATPAAGGGEVTIGTNTIPTDKHFVLLGETSTNEPNLIVSWQSDAPVMASGGFAGKGLLLTDLNASELSSGTVPLARLGTNTASAGQVLTAVDGATEWADAAGGVTLEQVAAGGFLNVSNSEVILNSDTYMAWSTNGAITLTAQTNNLGIVLSNGFASASFQNYGPGLFDVAWTLDGANWSKAMTNAEVTVGVINIITEAGSSDPMGITNLGLYSWTEPERFGKTNFTRGQILIVDRPKLADAAAPLRTVTNEAWRAVRNQTNWASIPAKSEVDLGGYGERLTAEWKRTATATTNADSLDWVWTGTNVWSVAGPPSVSVDQTEYSVVVSSLTNVLVTLPAAYTSSVPRVLFSHTAKSPAWSRLSSTATATNDTLEVAFTVPNADYGFFRIAIDDGTPSFGTLNGVLELTPRTIAATNSTTWGRGSGLVCVDGDYVYISVGTNAWKRATLEAW